MWAIVRQICTRKPRDKRSNTKVNINSRCVMLRQEFFCRTRALSGKTGRYSKQHQQSGREMEDVFHKAGINAFRSLTRREKPEGLYHLITAWDLFLVFFWHGLTPLWASSHRSLDHCLGGGLHQQAKGHLKDAQHIYNLEEHWGKKSVLP